MTARLPDAEELTAAGLVDPDDPRAADRLHLLRWLREQGFSLDQLRAATATADLATLAGDAVRLAGTHLSTEDVARRTGIPVERLVEVRRASGLEPVPADVPVYADDDIAAFTQLLEAATLFSWDELMLFLRVVGSSMARVADAATTLFLHDVEQPLRQAGASELDLALHGMRAIELMRGVSTVLRMLLRLHLGQAVARSRSAHGNVRGGSGLMVPMAVGFVDLVGYTPRAVTMTPEELAELVARFETTAHDLVTDLGGRLVKLIGDEVMFVAVEAATGADIAVALLTTFAADPALTPRGGLAYGEVLARAGDYFGPTVNLASRLAEQAVPGEVLATPEIAQAATGHHVEPAGRRLLKGFAEPITLVSLTP